jgi:cytochrome d ubiquinol oxidase subunit I
MFAMLVPTLLSRIQFGFTISYHIIFPSFTIGLAAWLAVLEALHIIKKDETYRRLFDFWLKIFAVAFGLGVVSGIVMALEFGTNWSRLSAASGPIQGPLLAYESFTAFALEASFFGILLFGRSKLPPLLYLASVIMVALGTTLSAFWIMVNNSWMQYPVGYVSTNGMFVPNDWGRIIFNEAVWTRFPHMLIASYLTGAFCVAATGAWYRLRSRHLEEGRVMLVMGLYLAAILVPIQLLFGHLVGDFVHDKQPIKFATVEGRWHDEQPAAEVLIAIPDAEHERNSYELKVPVLGSLIGSMSLTSREVGLTDFPRDERPPILIPFFAFRVMVGCGLLMLAITWLGSLLTFGGRLEKNRMLLWGIFLSWPLPFVAILTGWFTAEVGRQPWTVYGVMRTAQAVTPGLSTMQAATSLAVFVLIHGLIFSFGAFYIYRLLKVGPAAAAGIPGNPKRPLAVPGASPAPGPDAYEPGVQL